MVPKFFSSPEACEAASPSAWRSCGTSSPSSRAATAVEPKTPAVAVLCQPRW
jgi:hypothetical protein